jgi:IstB-like ATP binding protein
MLERLIVIGDCIENGARVVWECEQAEMRGSELFVARRYERGSMILTTDKSSTEWGQVLGDDMLATAILDRPAPAPLRRHQHQRPQLPAQRPTQRRHRR